MGESTGGAPRYTEVRFEHSRGFPDILAQLRVSLLVSTYQAGRLVCIGTHDGRLTLSFHRFEQVMGVAVHPRRIAVGTRREIWLLEFDRSLGPGIKPVGEHDGCFLARSAHVTGAILGHELAWAGDELWVVNTLFSCLATMSPGYSFRPRWKPPFIGELAAEDRCHLNGVAMEAGRPRFVTALAETNKPAGWRADKAHTGCLIDLANGRTILRGLSMPHSPRIYDGRLWLLNSGRGQLSMVDSATSSLRPVATLPGYTRGLDFHGPVAFVGLSKIRETNVFGGLPIAEQGNPLRCGIAIVDVSSGQPVASLEFVSGVEEIFAVQAIPGVVHPAIVGPDPEADGQEHVWLVPPLDQGVDSGPGI